jgi:hypothetical protein
MIEFLLLRLSHESRARNQTSRCTPANARQMPAVRHQMTVTQFIVCYDLNNRQQKRQQTSPLQSAPVVDYSA